jgi:hypothetical protein
MTHASGFKARLFLLCASLSRHSRLRPADQIILLSAFNKRSIDLRCPASKPPKSVPTDHSRPCPGQTLIAIGPVPN